MTTGVAPLPAAADIGSRIAGQMPLIALVLLCAVSAVLSDRFLSTVNMTNVLLQGSVMAVIAIGMTYVIICGGFDLSVGSVVALSGCVTAMVMIRYGILAGIIAGVAVGAIVGVINGLIVTKLQINPFIATLGTMVTFRGVTYLITGGHTIFGEDGLPASFNDVATDRILGIHQLIWLSALFFALFAWLLHATAYGKRLFATGGNREAAYLAGIAVDRVTISAYVWCGTLAGIAGVMLAARLQSGQPTAGEFYELTAIAAVVLGGASLYGGEGKLYNTIIGVFIMIVLANALNLMNVHSYWQRVAIGLVIVAAAGLQRFRRR
ncbi:MAG TPA: ABC transporter permease [Alphaproteobacteria bacterium]